MGSRVHPVTADSHSNSSALQHGSVHNDSSGHRLLQANSIAIPTASYKRKQKASDKPGFPTGAAISARMVFNRMYREKLMATSTDTSMCEDYPVYMELANAVKDNIRSSLYQDIVLKRGERTYTSVKIEYGSQLMQLKRRIVGKFPVLAAAQSYWIVTDFIKESMQRDKKALVEANKRAQRASSQNPQRVPDRGDRSNANISSSVGNQAQVTRADDFDANRANSVGNQALVSREDEDDSDANRADCCRIQGLFAQAEVSNANANRANSGTELARTRGPLQHSAMKTMSDVGSARTVRDDEQQVVTTARARNVNSDSVSIRAIEKNGEDEDMGSASRGAHENRQMDRFTRDQMRSRTKRTSGKRRVSAESGDYDHEEYDSDEMPPMRRRQQKHCRGPAKKKPRKGSRSVRYEKPLVEFSQSDEEDEESGSEEYEVRREPRRRNRTR